MDMNYSYFSSGIECGVVETATGNVIVQGLHQTEAKHVTKRLNSGAGFAGFTPEFFLNRFEVTIDEDTSVHH